MRYRSSPARVPRSSRWADGAGPTEADAVRTGGPAALVAAGPIRLGPTATRFPPSNGHRGEVCADGWGEGPSGTDPGVASVSVAAACTSAVQSLSNGADLPQSSPWVTRTTSPPAVGFRAVLPRPTRPSAAFVAALAGASLLLTGCSSASNAGGSSPPSTAVRTTTTTVPPTTTTTEQPGWTVDSSVGGRIAVDQQSVTEPDGHVVTLYRFRSGVTRFGLHVGSSDPPTGAATVAGDAGSAIGPDETPVLLAAFNGGFEASTGAGGFELNGQVLLPLQGGTASLVIDTNGTGHVGVWGGGFPAPGEQVESVRQNLAPLVVGGQPSGAVGDIPAWGATLGGGSVVARSALGEDAAGNLVYAGSMDALPSDLAAALVGEGTVTAMELDINPEWVQLAWAPAPGGALATGVPGQSRPADQYQVGWTRDFVTVLAAG